MHDDEDHYLYATEAERLASIVSYFDCEPQLAPAIRAYYRAILAERSYATKHPGPGCCSMAHEYVGDIVRTYACISDYQGLVAIYRLRVDGRYVRLTSWPQWLVELDRDAEWRAHCRALETEHKRRQRQARARMERLAARLMAAKPAPVAPVAPVAPMVPVAEAIGDIKEEDEGEKALREAQQRLAAKKAAKAASKAAAAAQAAAAVTTPAWTAPAAPAVTEGQFGDEIDMDDLEATLAELDGLAA